MSRPKPTDSSPASGRRPASIQDVAAAADVSTATVSRVLNSPGLVAPATTAKVQRAIQELGYKPNLFAQGLMTRKSHVLGIALPDIHGEFYSELLRGADAEARRLGYHLLVASEAHDAGEQERDGSLAFGLIDGVAVMITEPNESLWREAMDASLPIVVLDTDVQARGVDSVVVDNAVGTRQATEHLLSSVSPERCVFVGGPAENFDTRARAHAFLETLKKAGWEARPEQVVYGRYDVDWGQEWARSAIDSGRLAGAGVLAGNDEIALGVILAAHDSGLEVPGEVRVVGFDDTRLATLVRPRISTVRVPLADVGASAIRALVHRVENRDAPTTCVRLPTELIVRDSSR
jgi:LacI family transcriptional regulator